ncbi:MAG: molybdopterin-binding protein [Gammaproteobacteria bacterium]|nr:molybdopterin-binding protein [Gammaproteobacteria bacterium]
MKPSTLEQPAAWLDERIAALQGENADVYSAAGRVLAVPVGISGDHPRVPIAAVDGFALAAGETVGASDYNPLPFRVSETGVAHAGSSRAFPVTSGQALPDGVDTVIPLEETDHRGGMLDIYTPLAAGNNIVPAGREARSGETMLEMGRRLRAADAALLMALGFATVPVVGRPRVAVVVARDDVPDASGTLVRTLAAMDGGIVADPVYPVHSGLSAALVRPDADLVLVIGGSGLGSNDHAADALAAAGEMVFRGVAINPGETTTIGEVRDTPVIILPGPPLAALFAYDLIAGRAVRRLAGRDTALPYGTRRVTLARKIASGLGRMDCCRVRVSGDRAEPLAVSDNRTLSTAVRADGFVLITEQSEGYAEGAEVVVYLYDQRF